MLRSSLVSADDRVLVAVSGGPDSVALLHILHDLREEFGLHLEVAHLQHGIRGEEAEGDARFVRELAERLTLPVHIRGVSIPGLRAGVGKGNLEELARQERHRFFAEIAEERKLDKVAVAHTLDDQAETVLMWFLRGAGRKGLGGMAPRQAVNVTAGESSKVVTIIRPLLGIAKEELLEFLSQKHFLYRIDESNYDATYLRNWLRFELLPLLKRRIDPRLPCRLAQAAEVLREEAGYLETLAQKQLDGFSIDGTLSRKGFLGQPKAMQREVLRVWIKGARGHLRGLDFDHIEALLELISHGPPNSRLSLPGGWEFSREYDALRLARVTRAMPLRYSYPLSIDSALAIPEAGMTITCRHLPSPPGELPEDDSEAVFDVAALTEPLVVRNFRPGDRFQPFGMAGHKKVKNFFIEKKTPLATRAVLPLLVMGREVLWLPGYGRSNIGRIGPGAKEFLRFNMAKSGNYSSIENSKSGCVIDRIVGVC